MLAVVQHQQELARAEARQDQVFDRAWRHLEKARELEGGAGAMKDDGIVPRITWHCLEIVLSQLLGRRVLVTGDVGAPTVDFE